MTLSFKDSDGVEWYLYAVWHRPSPHGAEMGERPATVEDLLAALGQLSPGSDGPTGSEMRRIREAALLAFAGANETRNPLASELNEAADRALFTVGSASRQPEVDRLTARVAEQRSRIFVLVDELAATKAKLAESEATNEELTEELDAWRETGDLSMRAKLEGATRDAERWMGRAETAEHERDQLRSELASASRVVEAARDLYEDYRVAVIASCRADGWALDSEETHCALAGPRRLKSALDALASVGTTEPPRPEAAPCHRCGAPANVNDGDDGLGPPVCCGCYRSEAGESGPVCACGRVASRLCCGHPICDVCDHDTGSSGTAHARTSLPTEEPLPEPEPSGEGEHEAALRELIDSTENGPHKRLEAALAHARRLLRMPD